MMGKVLSIFLGCVLMTGIAGISFGADYDHTISERGIDFSWKIDGETLHVKLTARTTGWVGIGFNPEEQMKGANFVIGYIEDGKVVIQDAYGDEQRNHKEDTELGGTNDVTVVSGEEKNRSTTLEFTLPLNSGDKYDKVIDPAGETVVLLAYGGGRDSFRPKHRYRTAVKVNLASGKIM